MWISEHKFKNIILKARKKIYEWETFYKQPLSHKKRKIKKNNDFRPFNRFDNQVEFMKAHVCADMEITCNEYRLFHVNLGYVCKDVQEKMIKIVVETLKEEGVDGILRYYGKKPVEIPIEKNGVKFLRMTEHPNIKTDYNNKISYVGKNPGYRYKYNWKDGCIDCFNESQINTIHEKVTPLQKIYTKKELNLHAKEINDGYKETELAKNNISQYLEKKLKLNKKDEVGLYYELLGKDEFVYVNYTLDYSGKKAHFVTSVVGKFYYFDDINELKEVVKRLYKDYYYKNRLLYVTGAM